MVFSSFTFIFVFLPIVLLGYYLLKMFKPNLRNAFLLLVSIVFYSWGEPKYIILMVLSILINYILAILMDKSKNKKNKKAWLIIDIIINIAAIGVFKYADFSIVSINNLFGLSIETLKIALPIGISFYTFQILSYVIDVYRGTVKVQKNIINLATYIVLFPQLIAGPIVRYETIEYELNNRKENLELFTSGIKRFILGLGKKVIIANNVALIADTIYSKPINEIGTVLLWIAAVSYALQIYFDFSGYSDMAIGLGQMFGFNFLENFNYPYIADSITDFWRRWHISLSTWFKDYVYIPLGGNRVSKIKWIRNILIVWTLTGLWHGASWNFVCWGLYFGVILLLEKVLLSKVLEKTPKIIKHIYSIVLILIGWVIFRNENINTMLDVIKNMFIYKGVNLTYVLTNNYNILAYIPYIVLGIIGSTPLIKNIIKKMNKKTFGKIIADVYLIGILLLSIAMLLASTYNPFIYFRF